MEQVESRKRSPRAPSMSLSEAIEKALKVYEAEGKHPAPADVIAKHLGYKSPTSGSAATALASMRYYGLLDRPKEGFLAASRDLEAYKFAPNESVKAQLLAKWLKSPPLFAELLLNYPDSLPSDSNLKFDLIQRGFNPTTADECVSAFRDSVNYARYYDQAKPIESGNEVSHGTEVDEREGQLDAHSQQTDGLVQIAAPRVPAENKSDQIPIRLTGGRKAWLVVPAPFYESDKKRIIAQIDLLLTDEDAEQKEARD